MPHAHPDSSSDPPLRLRKRSVVIAGHATSVSLEEPFWRQLRRIAGAKGMTLAALIARVDQGRTGNLSSALRVFVLDEILAAASKEGTPRPNPRETQP